MPLKVSGTFMWRPRVYITTLRTDKYNSAVSRAMSLVIELG